MKLHSLFFKLFLWFWVATTLVALSLLLLETNRSDHLAKRWHRMTADAFTVYADSAADAHVDEAQWESKAYLRDLEKRTGIRAWLFDGQNREVSGYAPNARAAHPQAKTQRIRALITKARSSASTEFDPQGDVTLAAHATSPMKGQRYVLVGELPVARFGPWEADLDVQALRFLAVLLAAGVVCWGLGRHLTQPIVVLRDATRRMAAGDLSARPGAFLGRRRDELAELSRDFDGMAERIENLLTEQNRLVQSQRRLLGDVSHELRSPLARLGVALELARDSVPSSRAAALQATSTETASTETAASTQMPTPTLEESLDYIEHEAAHLGEMIDRLLTLARLESGVQELERTPVDLTTLVHAVVADADFEARSTRRSVVITQCDDCDVLGTPELLRSAIENVLRNAVRYTPEDTVVEVTLKVEADIENHDGGKNLDGESSPLHRARAISRASFSVRDYGPGVPEDQLEDVFRPFYRVAGARDRKSGGDGLGLAITARAVHLHGGKVCAANAPDGGLVVTIRLPLDATHQ